ncbi:MAG: hypothetical protein JWR03_954 [Cohnella sp.]|nr:hypothetical protein [Cohnella sp.]
MKSGYPSAALAGLADRLDGCGGLWVVGGSTGLALRGAQLDRPPRDLDIYADEEDIMVIHRCLEEYATDMPSLSQTERYQSILSHYSLDGTVVELVGGFTITAFGTRYRTEVGRLLHAAGDSYVVQGRDVRVVPLGHELLFNVLRERDDRASLIGSLIRQQPDRHLPILQNLLERNRILPDTVNRVRRFIDMEGLKTGVK